MIKTFLIRCRACGFSLESNPNIPLQWKSIPKCCDDQDLEVLPVSRGQDEHAIQAMLKLPGVE
jgi:hypothetical protein